VFLCYRFNFSAKLWDLWVPALRLFSINAARNPILLFFLRGKIRPAQGNFAGVSESKNWLAPFRIRNSANSLVFRGF